MVTNKVDAAGCCYLKASLPDQNNLVPFSNNILGQTYQKQFSGFGTEAARTGYQFLDFKDSPNNDIPGACLTSLDACFDLCDASATKSSSNSMKCVGIVFRYDNNQGDGMSNCCYLKSYIGNARSLSAFSGTSFGVTYARTRE